MNHGRESVVFLLMMEVIERNLLMQHTELNMKTRQTQVVCFNCLNTGDVSNVCRSGSLVVHAQVYNYVDYTYERPNIHVSTSKGATYGRIYLCQYHSKKQAASHWFIQFVLNILCNFSQKQLEVGWNINTSPS